MWGGVPRARRTAAARDADAAPPALERSARTWMKRRAGRRARSTSPDVARGSPSSASCSADLRPVHPVVDGRTASTSRTAATVRAYDVYSGRARVELRRASTTTTPLLLHAAGAISYGRTSLERAFSPVVAGDLVIATVEVAYRYDPETLQGVEISTYLPRRVLVALDKHTGDVALVAWATHGLDLLLAPGHDDRLRPAVAEGLVLAVGRHHDGDHNVSLPGIRSADRRAALAPAPGLRSAGAQPLRLRPSRSWPRAPSRSPTAWRTRARDSASSLPWTSAPACRAGSRRTRSSPSRKVELWYDAPVRTPTDGAIAARRPRRRPGRRPTDGRHVHAFDRRTGRCSGASRTRRDRIVYDVTGHFLGCRERRPARRRPAAPTASCVPATSRPARRCGAGASIRRTIACIGRGAVAGSEVLVPTREGLQRFALESDGAYRGTVPWPEDADPGQPAAARPRVAS